MKFRGCCFFPLRICFFLLRRLFRLQSWVFSGAGFFLPRIFFSLPPTVFPAAVSFFPLRRECILSAANLFCAVARCFFLLRWIFPAANRYCLLAFLPAADCPNIFFMPQNRFLTRDNFARKDKIRKMMS